MTKEQEEAIEFLEFYKKNCLKKEIENIDNYETVNDGEFVSHNIETVINMLKEKDKEIEKYKNMIIEHKKQLKQSGIYGYDYDLKID